MKTFDDNWGGKWTQDKVDIFIKYLSAYLSIMSKQKFKLIYFDGFAGSGKIQSGLKNSTLIEGVATQVLALNNPTGFSIYYLVDLNRKKAANLESLIEKQFPNNSSRKTYVVSDDCNKRLIGMADYLKKNKSYRALAYLDPYGMEVKWSSLQAFKSVPCDLWILVPTGVGINRMLTKSGEINDGWMFKLSEFFGMSSEEIRNFFYKEQRQQNLFGEVETKLVKEDRAIGMIIHLYQNRLKSIWNYVSKPFPMKSPKGHIMFHFLCVSQNQTGIKIADDIIGGQLLK